MACLASSVAIASGDTTTQVISLLTHPPHPSLLQWKKAIADGTVNQAAPTPPEVTAEAVAAGFSGSAGQPSIGQLMRFDGPAPGVFAAH